MTTLVTFNFHLERARRLSASASSDLRAGTTLMSITLQMQPSDFVVCARRTKCSQTRSAVGRSRVGTPYLSRACVAGTVSRRRRTAPPRQSVLHESSTKRVIERGPLDALASEHSCSLFSARYLRFPPRGARRWSLQQSWAFSWVSLLRSVAPVYVNGSFGSSTGRGHSDPPSNPSLERRDGLRPFAAQLMIRHASGPRSVREER